MKLADLYRKISRERLEFLPHAIFYCPAWDSHQPSDWECRWGVRVMPVVQIPSVKIVHLPRKSWAVCHN